MATAAAAPQLDGLELLPEPDGLELLPEQNGLLDALDDNIALAPAEPPLRPLPAPRPLPSNAKRKQAAPHFWQGPALQAGGGILTTLLVLAGIGLKVYYRVVTPIMNGGTNSASRAQVSAASAKATAMIAEARSVLGMIERNVQLAQQMTDATSAQRIAGNWALEFIDAIDAAEKLDRHSGTLIPLADQQTYANLGKSCESQIETLNTHIVHLASMPGVQPILADALDKAAAARPASNFAATIRSQGIGVHGIASIGRLKSEMQADRDSRRAEREAESARLQAEHDARFAQMRAEQEAQMAQMKADAERRTAEAQERMRAQSDAMRNLHPPAMRRGIRP